MLRTIWQKRKKRIANWWSELSTFVKKRELNKGKSDLTWKFYKKENLQSFQFAHALPKGMYPEYRNDVNNIIFVDNIKQHHRVDSIIARRKYEAIEKIRKGELAERVKVQRFLVSQKQNDEIIS